jgi:hypothetical protein
MVLIEWTCPSDMSAHLSFAEYSANAAWPMMGQSGRLKTWARHSAGQDKCQPINLGLSDGFCS